MLTELRKLSLEVLLYFYDSDGGVARKKMRHDCGLPFEGSATLCMNKTQSSESNKFESLHVFLELETIVLQQRAISVCLRPVLLGFMILLTSSTHSCIIELTSW
jgi:hypothetical protein